MTIQSKLVGLCGAITLLFFCGFGTLAAAQSDPAPSGPDISDSDTAPVIETLLADYEAYRLWSDPAEAARKRGELPTQWPDVTQDHQAEALRQARALLARAQSLGANHTLDTNILETILQTQVRQIEQDVLRVPFTGDSGFHSAPAFVIGRTRLRSAADAEAVIARLEAIPAYIADNIANMRRGMSTGFVAHTDPLATVITQLAEMQTTEPLASPLYAPFRTLPAQIDTSTAIRLRTEAAEAVKAVSYTHLTLPTIYSV